VNNAILVKIPNCHHNLIDQFFRSVLCNLELPVLQVVEHVLSIHVLKDDVVMVDVFKEVDELHDVGVLTHLQHIDLLPLLVDFDRLHLAFPDNFHSRFRFSAKMIGELYLAKLAFA